MKKIVVISIIIFSLTACSDFLDLNDPIRLVSGNFYQNKNQVEQAVNGVYSQLQSFVANQWIFNELVSDNTTVQINPQDRGQADRVESIDFWTFEATNYNLTQMYDIVYSAIHNLNYSLNEITTNGSFLEESDKNQFVGELKFLRGYFYFNLVQYFGKVVLLTEPLLSPDEAYNATRSDVDVVYNQIIADLTDASQLLPSKSEYADESLGRATKGAALSLLGKVYLTVKDYPNAESTLRQVLNLGYSLLPDYTEVFNPLNKNHSESVFEVQYQGGNTLGEHSSFMYYFAPFNSEGLITGFTSPRSLGWNMPTRNLMNEFEPGDLRKDVSFLEGFTNSAGEWVAVPFINKFNHMGTVSGQTNDNWPVIRYADVLLMLAEAINEQSGPSDAYNFLNQVRERAELDPLEGLTKEAFRTAVLKERRVELAFENHRWFDLKRTKTESELITYLNQYGADELANPSIDRSGVSYRQNDYIFEAHEIVFPIPDRQVMLSNGNIIQNTGY